MTQERDEQLASQVAVCREVGAEPHPVHGDLKVGIARNINSGAMPIHGVRMLPERGTSGWYFWAGDYSDDPDFFVALHASHLAERAPLVLPFLALPPGWRFLTDGSYKDVWFDEEVDLTPLPDEA